MGGGVGWLVEAYMGALLTAQIESACAHPVVVLVPLGRLCTYIIPVKPARLDD